MFTTGQSIGPWTLVSGSVDLPGPSTGQPAGGNQILDLDGASPGGLAQTFDTVAGQNHQPSYALAENPAGTAIKTGQALVNGQVAQKFSVDITGKSPANLGRIRQNLGFPASGSSTVLEFLATPSPDAFRPAIDDVRIVPTATAPTVRPGGPYAGNEGATIPITGTVTPTVVRSRTLLGQEIILAGCRLG